MQLPDNWPTKSTRSGWWILDPSTNIHPALVTAVDTCTHWVPIFHFIMISKIPLWTRRRHSIPLALVTKFFGILVSTWGPHRTASITSGSQKTQMAAEHRARVLWDIPLCLQHHAGPILKGPPTPAIKIILLFTGTCLVTKPLPGRDRCSTTWRIQLMNLPIDQNQCKSKSVNGKSMYWKSMSNQWDWNQHWSIFIDSVRQEYKALGNVLINL